MKKFSKSKVAKIIEWCLSVLSALLIGATGFHWSSIFLVIAAVLMAPISPIRAALKKHKIKGWLAVTLSVIALFIGVLASPVDTDTPKNPEADTSVSDTTTESIHESLSESKKDATAKNSENKSEASSKPETSNGNGLSPKPVKPTGSNLPKYDGKPFAVLNGGKPSFSKLELTTKAYEKYSQLDSLGRCRTAVASLGIETMPKDGEKRGSISSIHPSGWRQARYDSISTKDLYNRCHLIGWQLSAENANPSNLITGTRYMNVDGMLPFENMVADYIKETKNHVAYRVTPIYSGRNLVANGVQIEAYSIEDKGDGICFNVYCFNVQPGIKINYATGESSGAGGGMLQPNKPNPKPTQPKPKPTKPQETKPNTPPLPSDSKTVYITPTGKCYHLDKDCAGKNAIPKKLSEVKDSHRPCKTCAQ